MSRLSLGAISAAIATLAATGGASASVVQPTCGSTFSMTGYELGPMNPLDAEVRIGQQPAEILSASGAGLIIRTPDFAPGPRYEVSLYSGERFVRVMGVLRDGCYGRFGDRSAGPAIGKLLGSSKVEIGSQQRLVAHIYGTARPTELRFDGVPGTSTLVTPNLYYELDGDGNLTRERQDGWLIGAIPPAHAEGWGDVTVIVDGEEYGSTGAADNDLEYVGPPTIRSIAPSIGPTTGGNDVVLTLGRTYFEAPTVSFGNTPGTVTRVGLSSNVNDGTYGQFTITATAPARPLGKIDVTVGAGGSTIKGATSTADDYTYVKIDPTPTPSPIVDPKPTPTPTVEPTPTPTPPPTPTPAPTDTWSFTASGTTTINTVTKGTMPLTGGLTTRVDAAGTTLVDAALTLNDTQGRLTAFGFLPVTASIEFAASGPTTGTLSGDQLATQSKFRIKVRSVKAFGAIPLAGGNTCQTKQLSDVNLRSDGAFTRAGGGTLTGTFKISDLNGCGPFGGLISSSAAGAGNAMRLTLTPSTS